MLQVQVYIKYLRDEFSSQLCIAVVVSIKKGIVRMYVPLKTHEGTALIGERAPAVRVD